MPTYRDSLPQLAGRPFLTDGGIETDLIFNHGVDLPHGAAYTLLADDAGVAKLSGYFEDYLAIARGVGWGVVLESATWRANPDWAARVGTPPDALARFNRAAIDLLTGLRDRHAGDGLPVVVSGCVGPRSDAYRPTAIMSVAEAEAYHAPQIATFAETEADLVTAMTLTNTPEATGIVRGAQAAGMPVVIAFTVETDGRLPTGERLADAIARVDDATGGGPAYYMINCAHPTHFAAALEEDATGRRRIRGLRANASAKSHAELDESTELDAGDPIDLGRRFAELRGRFPHLTVLGGCCGTDHRHVREIALACAAACRLPRRRQQVVDRHRHVRQGDQRDRLAARQETRDAIAALGRVGLRGDDDEVVAAADDPVLGDARGGVAAEMANERPFSRA